MGCLSLHVDNVNKREVLLHVSMVAWNMPNTGWATAARLQCPALVHMYNMTDRVHVYGVLCDLPVYYYSS